MNPNVIRMVAFIRSHGFVVVSNTETTITAEMPWVHSATGETGADIDTIPATWKAVRDWLGY